MNEAILRAQTQESSIYGDIQLAIDAIRAFFVAHANESVPQSRLIAEVLRGGWGRHNSRKRASLEDSIRKNSALGRLVIIEDDGDDPSIRLSDEEWKKAQQVGQ